jgi:hypothetical protein
MEKEKSISQADLVGEKKTKITQDYEFIKEIGSGKLMSANPKVPSQKSTKLDTNCRSPPDVSRS